MVIFCLKTILCADDLEFFLKTREDLQVGLDILYDYCNTWKLTINTEKTSIIIFRKEGNVTQSGHLCFCDRRLKLLEKNSYLGLTLSSRGKFAQTQSNLADRGLRAMFKLFRSVNELNAPEPSFLCTLVDKLEMPVLLYGSEMWGFHKAVDIEKVHLLFCKKILHLKRNTANYFIYGILYILYMVN